MKGRATFGVLLALVVVFSVEAAKGAIGDEVALLSLGALPNEGGLHREYWRLLTYSVLHLNYLHLVLNSALLWWLGNIVERRVGAAAFGVAYFASVVVAGVAITLVHMSSPRPGSSVGASGGIFGLLACAMLLLHRSDALAFGQSKQVRLWLWIVLGAGFGASLLPGVSLAGHAGGFVAGLLAGWILPVVRDPKRDQGHLAH